MQLHSTTKYLVLCIVLCIAQLPSVAEQSPSHDIQANKIEQLNKKLLLIEFVLNDIKRRGSELFATEPMFSAGYDYAKDQLNKARQAMSQNNLQAAEKAVEEAFVNITFTRSFLQKKPVNNEIEIERYNNLRNSVTEYQIVLKDILTTKPDDNATDVIQQVEYMKNTASKHFHDKQFKLANNELSDANQLLITTLTNIQANETHLVSLDFDTPKDEYLYEKNRHSSYQMLLRLRQQSSVINDRVEQLMSSYLKQARVDFEEAETLSAQADYERAIKLLESANDNIKRALRISGLNLL